MGQAKRYSHAYTNFTLPGLQRILPQALDSVSVTSIHKYFRKARDYEKAYHEGREAGKEVENAVSISYVTSARCSALGPRDLFRKRTERT